MLICTSWSTGFRKKTPTKINFPKSDLDIWGHYRDGKTLLEMVMYDSLLLQIRRVTEII